MEPKKKAPLPQDHDFKNFAFDLWQDNATRRYYLYLQNNYSITIITVLYAKWCAIHNHTFPIICIPFAKNFEKQHIVPLRNERRACKNQKKYEEVLAKELYWEVRLIESIVKQFPPTKR